MRTWKSSMNLNRQSLADYTEPAWGQFDTALVRSESHLQGTKTIANPSRIACTFFSQACTAISHHYSLYITTGQRLRTRLQHSEKHNTADELLVFLPHLSNKSPAISCMSSDVKHSWLQTRVALRDDLPSSVYYGIEGFSVWFCFRTWLHQISRA